MRSERDRERSKGTSGLPSPPRCVWSCARRKPPLPQRSPPRLRRTKRDGCQPKTCGTVLSNSDLDIPKCIMNFVLTFPSPRIADTNYTVHGLRSKSMKSQFDGGYSKSETVSTVNKTHEDMMKQVGVCWFVAKGYNFTLLIFHFCGSVMYR